MALPDFDTELHSAAESLTMATDKTYLKQVELEAIATQINTAARGGQTKCIYQSVLSEYAKQELSSKGYDVKPASDKYSHAVIISWDN